MKGIILAGGKGTRLSPLTIAVCKQLLPVYDKPMIYYPINTLVNAGIEEILIITTPEDQSLFKKLLGTGEMFNCSFDYAIQENPGGIAEAFIIGEKFIQNESVILILGDNIFDGYNFNQIINQYSTIASKATIFATEVSRPQDYGVIELSEDDKIISIIEKPENPKSNYAIPGVYIYPSDVIEIAKNIIPSKRGEKEITDIHNVFLKQNKLNVIKLPKNVKWFDAGTIKSLFQVNYYFKNKSNGEIK